MLGLSGEVLKRLPSRERKTLNRVEGRSMTPNVGDTQADARAVGRAEGGSLGSLSPEAIIAVKISAECSRIADPIFAVVGSSSDQQNLHEDISCGPSYA
jgi:hypothetical protein